MILEVVKNLLTRGGSPDKTIEPQERKTGLKDRVMEMLVGTGNSSIETAAETVWDISFLSERERQTLWQDSSNLKALWYRLRDAFNSSLFENEIIGPRASQGNPAILRLGVNDASVEKALNLYNELVSLPDDRRTEYLTLEKAEQVWQALKGLFAEVGYFGRQGLIVGTDSQPNQTIPYNPKAHLCFGPTRPGDSVFVIGPQYYYQLEIDGQRAIETDECFYNG